MRASRLPHLTVLALVPSKAEPDKARSVRRKIAARPSLATSPRSCILSVHSVRRSTSCPTKRWP